MIGPYKETQSFMFGELLRAKRYIFFFNFVSLEESYVTQYRDQVEEKNCILQFLYNDLFRFEPLKGAKIQYNLAQSSVYIFFKKDEQPENEVINFVEELLQNSYFLLNFIKYNNYLLTKQQFELILLMGRNSFLEKLGNFYSLLLRKFSGIMYYYYYLFYYFLLIKKKKYANFSTINSEKEKS